MAAVGEEDGVDARRYSIDLLKQTFPYCEVGRNCRELARMFSITVLVKLRGGVAEAGNWRTKPTSDASLEWKQ